MRHRIEGFQRALATESSEDTFAHVVVDLVGDEFNVPGFAAKIAPEHYDSARTKLEAQLEADQKKLEPIEAEYAAELADVEASYSDFYINQL